MRIQILTQESAFLLGFAKSKLAMLSSLRKNMGVTILSKTIYVGAFSVHLVAAKWGDSITLNGVGEYGWLFATGTGYDSYGQFFSEYRVNVAGLAEDSERKSVISSPIPYGDERYEVHHQLFLPSSTGTRLDPDTTKKASGVVMHSINGFFQYGEPVFATPNSLTLGDAFPIDAPAFATAPTIDPLAGTDGPPWVVDDPELWGYTNIYLSDWPTSVVAMSAYRHNEVYSDSSLILSTAEFVSGPYEVRHVFLPRTLKVFGGDYVSGTEIPPIDSYKIADYFDFLRSPQIKDGFLYAIVMGGNALRLDYYPDYRQLLDIYKVDLSDGTYTINGTTNVAVVTGLARNTVRLVIDNSTESDYFGYSFLSADDTFYLYPSHEGFGSSVDPIVLNISDITGTSRTGYETPVGPFQELPVGTAATIYRGEGVYYLIYTCTFSEFRSAVGKIVIERDEYGNISSTDFSLVYLAPVNYHILNFSMDTVEGTTTDKMMLSIENIYEYVPGNLELINLNLVSGKATPISPAPENILGGVYIK